MTVRFSLLVGSLSFDVLTFLDPAVSFDAKNNLIWTVGLSMNITSYSNPGPAIDQESFDNFFSSSPEHILSKFDVLDNPTELFGFLCAGLGRLSRFSYALLKNSSYL